MNNSSCVNQGQTLKPATTFKEQVELLEQRGLIITDKDFALDVLSKVNYYRFSAYLLPFKNQESDFYGDKASFNSVYRIYEFDRKLRNLILSAIEPIEILLKTQLAYYHAHKYGAEGFISSGNFENEDWHERFIVEFNQTVRKNNKALFIKHHLENYNGRFPVWVAVEVFSFGMLSKFYSNMKSEDRKHIAKKIFCSGPDHLESWLKCLTYLRNRCAHYMRLYFQKFVVFPKLPRGSYKSNSHKVFDAIFVMKYLYLDRKQWNNGFVRILEALIAEYDSDIQLKYIGFPDNWLELLETKH